MAAIGISGRRFSRNYSVKTRLKIGVSCRVCTHAICPGLLLPPNLGVLWLAEDIVAYTHYYIDEYCEDDSEKERVFMEIRKKAKEKGLL